MIPGEYFLRSEPIELNEGRSRVRLRVDNAGDRPIQVGSHTHFFEVNRFLLFDRASAYGCRLDIPAGTALRFEPGEGREVDLVPLGWPAPRPRNERSRRRSARRAARRGARARPHSRVPGAAR